MNVVVVAALVVAHIQLVAPTPRYASSGEDGLNKHCPCGSGGGDQYCSNGVTTDGAYDAARATKLAPGATTTLQWNEVVGHTGRFRVAFGPNGAVQSDFDEHILADFADPAGSNGGVCVVDASPTDVKCTGGNSDAWSLELKLPTTSCNHCTLQLLQIMNGDTADPVVHLNPNSDRTYFTCADLVLGDGEAGGCSSTSTSSVAAVVLAAVWCRRRASSAR
jgi:hypothetical protein